MENEIAKLNIRSERNYGIDLLRIVAMFMVCILHVIQHGGVLSSAYGTNYQVAYFVELSAFCAVNCYALISGYVGVKSKYKVSNIVYLWLQVVFYCFIISIVFSFFNNEVDLKYIINSFFPIFNSSYWYFTAYFGLFFLIPIFNVAINSLNKGILSFCLIVLTFLFCAYSLFGDIFNLGQGYSMIWLAFLYLIGGYMSKYKPFENIKSKWFVVAIIVLILITWLSRFFIKKAFQVVFGLQVSSFALRQYVSPTIFLIAICMLEVFSKIKFNKTPNLIAFFAPISFGVYVIHENDLIRNNLISQRFSSFASFNPILMVLAVLGTALGIYVVCSLIDYLRLLLFKALKVKPTLEKLENKLKNKIFKEEDNV